MSEVITKKRAIKITQVCVFEIESTFRVLICSKSTNIFGYILSQYFESTKNKRDTSKCGLWFNCNTYDAALC